MNTQPQPPARRLLHRANDPDTVIRDAEIPYNYDRDAALAAATRRFFSQLSNSGMPHLLVGALAMLQHIDSRTTRDIDLILALEDIEKLPNFTLEERNEWFATGTSGPLRIDLLFTANPFFAGIMERHAETRHLHDFPVRCATPEGIILLKLFALPSLYRQGNVDRAALYETDILQLLHHYPVSHEVLLESLTPFMLGSDIRALRSVLHEIHNRLHRLTNHSEN